MAESLMARHLIRCHLFGRGAWSLWEGLSEAIGKYLILREIKRYRLTSKLPQVHPYIEVEAQVPTWYHEGRGLLWTLQII